MKDAKDKDGRTVKILGRAGLIYNDTMNEYFVDCEMLTGPKFDLVLYSDDIRYADKSNTPISIDKQKEIIATVLKLLSDNGVKVDLK